MSMQVVDNITFDQVRAAKPKMIFYSVNTCWWTHDPEHLRTDTPVPTDPSGSVLFETGDAEGFLNAAVQNPAHYGRHRLLAFMAAHHLNSIVSVDDPRPTCAATWEEYNKAIDAGIRPGPIGVLPVAKRPEPPETGEIVARCVLCSSEFTNTQLKGASACPKCGNEGLPMSPKQDVEIKVNWHELRILTIWAEHWANHIKDAPDAKGQPVQTIFAIAKRLQDQHPLMSPLTLSGEFEQLKAAYPGAEVKGNITAGGPLPTITEKEQ